MKKRQQSAYTYMLEIIYFNVKVMQMSGKGGGGRRHTSSTILGADFLCTGHE